uniref:Uncharacterized protein n=1 Tax=Oryza punctata TaxID=4537 RepID=A0A0E0MF54_ORYPU
MVAGSLSLIYIPRVPKDSDHVQWKPLPLVEKGFLIPIGPLWLTISQAEGDEIDGVELLVAALELSSDGAPSPANHCDGIPPRMPPRAPSPPSRSPLSVRIKASIPATTQLSKELD